jgi:hypothetical protein
MHEFDESPTFNKNLDSKIGFNKSQDTSKIIL